jgi:hypothetical protein
MQPEGSLLPPVHSNPRQFGPFRISAYFHLAPTGAHFHITLLQPEYPSAHVQRTHRVTLVSPTELPVEPIS